MPALNLFPPRIRFVNADGTLTPDAYRALWQLVERTGGALGNVGGDTFVPESVGSIEAQQSAGGDITADVYAGRELQAMGEMLTQPCSPDSLSEMVIQPLPDRAMTAPEAITVTVSPFTYRAGRDGYYIVTGGTVTKQEYGRGAVFTDVGLLTSMLPILLGDSIRVTYTALPTITFIPR